MPANKGKFQKFKDNLGKKKLKRLDTNQLQRGKNRSYLIKLANSLKRRACSTPVRNGSSTARQELQTQRYRKEQQQQQKQLEQQRRQQKPQPVQMQSLSKHNPPKQRKTSSWRSPLSDLTSKSDVIEEILSSDEDDCILLEPVVAKINLDEDSEEEVAKVPTVNEEELSSTISHFEVDKKREYRLWESYSRGTGDKALVYYTKSSNSQSRTDPCVVLDKSHDKSKSVNNSCRDQQMKPQLNRSLDESVIFVQEDFIPLASVAGEDDNSSIRKRKCEYQAQVTSAVKTPKRSTQRMNESLFTSTERKKLADYNSNTYNPGVVAEGPVTHKRPIIIDGSNVAFGHGRSNVFSSEGIKYCIEYFEKMGHDVKVVIPLFRRNTNKSSNPGLLDELYKEGKIVFTPCKNLPNQQVISYDDRFILQLAYERNAAVVSNDNYRDLINENPAFKKIIESRVIGYSWCDNILILPKDPYGRFGPPLSEILRC